MFSRYRNIQTINVTDDNTTRRILSCSPGISKKIRDNIQAGNITFVTKVLNDSDRLDILAGQQYNDSSLWWIIAAANGIGYAMQIKEGMEIIIPTNIDQIALLV